MLLEEIPSIKIAFLNQFINFKKKFLLYKEIFLFFDNFKY
jgi:hypothetical protein